jgi:ABC-2 type transport system permease protein
MRAFAKLAVVQTKLYLREPMALFFTLLFGPMLLLLMGLIFSGTPQLQLNGLSQMDISVPSYIALMIGITALTSLPIGAATRRESGVLRRFAATPLKPLVYFLADILAPLVVILLGIVLLVLMGFFIYHVRFSGQWLNVCLAVVLSVLSFFALGYAIAGLAPNTRTAVIVGNVLIIPMTILSGAMVPLEVMPPTVNSIARFIPLTHAVSLIRGLWFGGTWGEHLLETAVLGGLLVLGMAVVAYTFKWE